MPFRYFCAGISSSCLSQTLSPHPSGNSAATSGCPIGRREPCLSGAAAALPHHTCTVGACGRLLVVKASQVVLAPTVRNADIPPTTLLDPTHPDEVRPETLRRHLRCHRRLRCSSLCCGCCLPGAWRPAVLDGGPPPTSPRRTPTRHAAPLATSVAQRQPEQIPVPCCRPSSVVSLRRACGCSAVAPGPSGGSRRHAPPGSQQQRHCQRGPSYSLQGHFTCQQRQQLRSGLVAATAPGVPPQRPAGGYSGGTAAGHAMTSRVRFRSRPYVCYRSG